MTHLARDLGIALDPARLLREAGLQPDPFQEEICRSVKDMLVLASRQGGKTTAAACAAAHRALYQPRSEIVIIAPTLRQAVRVLRKTEPFLHVAVPSFDPASNTEVRIELKNGSQLIALPSDPDTIRGYTAHLLLIDEAARVEDEIYEAAEPMLTTTDGRTIALTTPAGPRGWFYHAWMNNTDEWQRIRVRADQCSRIPPAFLARKRRSMTAAVYATEYDCKFNDPIGAVFHSNHVYAALDTDLKPLFAGGW
jgi:terminase large subunit-like protein